MCKYFERLQFFFFKSSNDKFESVAFCYSKYVQVFKIINRNNISIFTVKRGNICQGNLKKALLYKTQSTAMKQQLVNRK